MQSTKEYQWFSRHWNQQNNSQVPYNGVQINAIANYGYVSTPPTAQNLVSVAIEVIDYTYDPNGVVSSLTLHKTDTWYDIPIPENTEISPPEPNADFTVESIGGESLGQIKLQVTVTGTYINVQFQYGLFNRAETETGFIMNIEETFDEGLNTSGGIQQGNAIAT